ncbi:30S ribosomal protein S6 [Anthocerotibacter panamensis]|uniref:30S ribosomal protein S6 n=1 Tax=Anthocerotibacter panamensis TaxID=2857077 RepID=UPI001C404778|nr:30S ribosomal protein S6 [Anthocerotibacter panamensis]
MNLQVLMRRYEAMYILRPTLTEEELEQSVNLFEQTLRSQGVEDLATERRGKRRLAYEIQKNKEGIYIQMTYSATGPINAELERMLRLNESVLRHSIFREGDE